MTTISDTEFSKDDNNLSEVACNVKSHLLLCYNAKCTKQFTKSSTVWTTDNDYEWLLRLMCKKCKLQWAVCYKCNSCNSALLTKRQINVHKKNYHKSNATKIQSKKCTNSVIEDIDEYLLLNQQKIKKMIITQ